jgi:DNA-binding SARP family transcriptional activator
LKLLWAENSAALNYKLHDAERDLLLIKEADAGMLVFETALSILGAAAGKSGDYAMAEKVLISAFNASREKQAQQTMCGILFHVAKMYFSSGNQAQGMKYLREAMECASAGRYFMFRDIHIPTLIEMVLRSIRINHCTDFAGELLEKFFDHSTAKYLTEMAKAMQENQFTHFPVSFIEKYRLNRCEQLYFVKACLFGKPEIYINGVLIPDSEWKTKKVKGMLEFLLLNCGKAVTKEALMDLLWPESDSRSAAISLRTALYQLRKVLSKYNVRVLGSNPLIYETLDGLQIKDRDALQTDMQLYFQLYDSVSKHAGTSVTKEDERMEAFEKIISLYKGDLLEGSDYGDYLTFKRERCKSIFVEVCHRFSSVCIKHGKLQKAEEVLKRSLEAEPLNENLCLELLRLYISQGLRSKAVSFYNSFKKRLERELHITVDKRLTEVIRQ